MRGSVVECRIVTEQRARRTHLLLVHLALFEARPAVCDHQSHDSLHCGLEPFEHFCAALLARDDERGFSVKHSSDDSRRWVRPRKRTSNVGPPSAPLRSMNCVTASRVFALMFTCNGESAAMY